MNKEADKIENMVHEQDKQPDIKSKISVNKVPETGGFDGPEPTRYGDWEKNGRCVDF